MLALEESIAFHQVLIVLNGVHIHIAQPADLILQGGDLLFHGRQILQGLIPKGGGASRRQLIFFPHVIDLVLNGFLCFFPLGVQTVYFLVQAGKRGGQALPVLKETLLSGGELFLSLQVSLKLQLPLASGDPGSGQAFCQGTDLLFLSLHLSCVPLYPVEDFLFFFLKTGKLPADTVQVLLREPLGLADLFCLCFQGGYPGCPAA